MPLSPGFQSKVGKTFGRPGAPEIRTYLQTYISHPRVVIAPAMMQLSSLPVGYSGIKKQFAEVNRSLSEFAEGHAVLDC